MKGFTRIELSIVLIAMAILAILAVVVVPYLINFFQGGPAPIEGIDLVPIFVA